VIITLWAYELQVQSQPPSQSSQQSQSQSQPQSGQPSQQSTVAPLLQHPEVFVAGEPARLVAAREDAIAKEPKTFVNI
jgi:hypothetical protein